MGWLSTISKALTGSKKGSAPSPSPEDPLREPLFDPLFTKPKTDDDIVQQRWQNAEDRMEGVKLSDAVSTFLPAFRAFAASEFSAENVDFYLSAEKQGWSNRRLYEAYCAPDAPTQVNVTGLEKMADHAAKGEWEQIDPIMESAKKTVRGNLLDTHSRFIRSSQLKKALYVNMYGSLPEMKKEAEAPKKKGGLLGRFGLR
jgi:hypothetical protein